MIWEICQLLQRERNSATDLKNKDPTTINYNVTVGLLAIPR